MAWFLAGTGPRAAGTPTARRCRGRALGLFSLFPTPQTPSTTAASLNRATDPSGPRRPARAQAPAYFAAAPTPTGGRSTQSPSVRPALAASQAHKLLRCERPIFSIVKTTSACPANQKINRTNSLLPLVRRPEPAVRMRSVSPALAAARSSSKLAARSPRSRLFMEAAEGDGSFERSERGYRGGQGAAESSDESDASSSDDGSSGSSTRKFSATSGCVVTVCDTGAASLAPRTRIETDKVNVCSGAIQNKRKILLCPPQTRLDDETVATGRFGGGDSAGYQQRHHHRHHNDTHPDCPYYS
jgi:hypothetical protein